MKISCFFKKKYQLIVLQNFIWFVPLNNVSHTSKFIFLHNNLHGDIDPISDRSRMICPCVPASMTLKMTLKTPGTTGNRDAHTGPTKFNLSLLVLVTLLVSEMFGGFLTYVTKVAVVSICIRLHNFTRDDNELSLSSRKFHFYSSRNLVM